MIVIGGGPAGSLAALLLARGGCGVELLEQHRFPRDKVCGECLSIVGLDVLARAGLTGTLRALGPIELTRALIHPGEGPTVDVPLPRAMWGLSRHALDGSLLAVAAAAGVTVHQPARCEGVQPGVRPTVIWRDLQTNVLTTAAADWVVVADGKGTLLPAPAPASGDLGIKTHFADVDGPRDAIELFAGPGCYGGLAAVEGERWNAAFAVPASLVRACGGRVGAAFDRIVAHNAVLVRRLRPARRLGLWLTSPLPRFAVTPDWPIHVVPVGNAAAALEPIGGEGMGLALRSAELAAAAILDGQVSELSAHYQGLWKVRRAVCRGIAQAVATPALADAAAPLLAVNRRLASIVMGWAGKAG